MSQPEQPLDLARRGFLRGAALTGAAVGLTPVVAVAQSTPGPAPAGAPTDAPPAARAPVAGRPNLAAEMDPPAGDPNIQESCGADFMVDVLKTLDLDYIAVNPASSFRALHESLVNYGGNKKPELLTVLHEEIGAAMAQGYAKIAGKPMGLMVHGTVGLQHASMGLYNAWCDRVPIYTMIGNILDGDKRGLVSEWQHSAIDPAGMVRDFIKWDDQPTSLQHFADSAARAYQVMNTVPRAPVIISIDTELQENPMPRGPAPRISKIQRVSQPTADPAALAEVAKLLVAAESPVILADRVARTQAGMDRLVELAELLQCAVIDQGGRTNFPSHHPLNQSGRSRGLIGQADLIVALEVSDLWFALNSFTDRIIRTSSSAIRKDARTVHICARDLDLKANYQEQGRFQPVDLLISGDPEASLPGLIEACRQLLEPARQEALKARGARLAAAAAASLEQCKADATIGWDASPITTGRLCAELYHQIRNDDWSLVGQALMGQQWPRRLWKNDRIYRHSGTSGGWGLGYSSPGALGGALANREHGRLSVALQGDGDFLYAPSTLWTAAHHRIPLLWVMHNNRAYNTELMYVQQMANRMDRGIRNTTIGNVINDPNVDFATVARGFGVYAEGPIEKPQDLAPALARALAVVRQGKPALVDVICEPR